MNNPAPPHRLAIFGDSHYACLRSAHTQGLVDLAGLDVEYWGHLGQRFNMLEYRDGAIRALDDLTAARFAKFNEKGRLFLPAADFDSVLFMGCRLDVSRLFLGLVDAEMRGAFPSADLCRRMLRGRLDGLAPYGFARAMAAAGQARIYLHPVTMFAHGARDYEALLTPHMTRATPAARNKIWKLFADTMAEDGVTLLPQLDHTFVLGVFTDPIYMTETFDKSPDYTHRSASYGALVYRQLLDLVAPKMP